MQKNNEDVVGHHVGPDVDWWAIFHNGRSFHIHKPEIKTGDGQDLPRALVDERQMIKAFGAILLPEAWTNCESVWVRNRLEAAKKKRTRNETTKYLGRCNRACRPDFRKPETSYRIGTRVR